MAQTINVISEQEIRISEEIPATTKETVYSLDELKMRCEQLGAAIASNEHGIENENGLIADLQQQIDSMKAEKAEVEKILNQAISELPMEAPIEEIIP